MNNQSTNPTPQEFSTGHTAQYITLAEGLLQAIEALETDLAYIEKAGLSNSSASLRLEARCATIAVLSAALCECVANTVLATVLAPPDFRKAEQAKMPRKWSHEIPRALNSPPPNAAIVQELQLLHEIRHTIVHSKATIFLPGETVHIQGNDPLWIHLTPEKARRFVTLPLRVSETIPPAAGIVCQTIGSSLRQRQPRLPCPHVDEVLTAMELLAPAQRQLVYAALRRIEAAESRKDMK
ncbi:hypothetical protein GALL_290150 [mine drainage metagenome]|uniref:Uncharacterized protein n=1 Tax=mine drainage metagenome TaxID=410659 RepID=A0A1J5QZF9_9ZZZZ